MDAQPAQERDDASDRPAENTDGIINGADFAIFATSFKRSDENPGGCE